MTREGYDLTALLHTIANPLADIPLMTVLRSPLAGLSDESLLRLRMDRYSLIDGLRRYKEAGLPDAEAAKLERFLANLARWRQEQFTLPIDLLIVRALGDCGFDWIPESNTGANVERYLHLARTVGDGLNLPKFLAEVTGIAEALDKEAELSDDDQGDRVQVLTVHAAKGLEFPVVFVAAMEKEGRGANNSFNFTPEVGMGVRWRNPENPAHGLKDGWHTANSDAVKDRELEESSRLFYVAMTRAEDHLVLSYAATDKPSKEWAGIVEARFGLKDMRTSAEPNVVVDHAPDGREFSVSLRVAHQPPVDSGRRRVMSSRRRSACPCPALRSLDKRIPWYRHGTRGLRRSARASTTYSALPVRAGDASFMGSRSHT